jgi:hypothetical protein
MATVENVQLWEGSEHECWPGRIIDGTPVFSYEFVPPGLSTRRQLRAAGLCPGRREPFGRLEWITKGGGRRWAWLYVTAWAKPSRVQSPAQAEALAKAMTARRTCAAGHVADHCVRLSDKLCGDHAYEADIAAGRWGVAA